MMAPFFVALTIAVILQAQHETAPRDDVKGAAPSGTISGRITLSDEQERSLDLRLPPKR
jgi:hypothetical protein